MIYLASAGEYTGAPLTAAGDVAINSSINDDLTLEFEIPVSEGRGIAAGRTVYCEDEEYRVLSLQENQGKYNVKCQHMFVFQAKRAHLPSVASTSTGDFIGEELYKVARQADDFLTGQGVLNYYLISDGAVFNNLGMTLLSGSIDYEAEDKTNLWDVLQNIITNAGRGELFFRTKAAGNGKTYSYLYGLVERIGQDKGDFIRLSDLSDVSIETDITDMVTMLYPYGDNDMDITGASQNTDATPYILSENAYDPVYGCIPGQKIYKISDIETSGPDKLFNRALWDFDPANPDRIDVPSYNISGNVDKLHLRNDIELGDTVTILDGKGNAIKERIISIKKYPYSGKPSEVSIGRVKKDAFFYLNQLGVLVQRYKNISAKNGKIYGSKVSGNLSASTLAAVATTAETARNVANGSVVIDSSGLRILSAGGSFMDASGDSFTLGECIVITGEKSTVNADELSVSGLAFTTDENGNLYFNGQKIQIIEEETA
ncbi:MAG: phage tail spike protein [Candidatus Ornithomonoglobus sp.]